MRYTQFACALLVLYGVVVCVGLNPPATAVADEASPDMLQQRVNKLETQVHELRQLVHVLQAEQIRDLLPVKQSTIHGEWVAKTDSQQTITLIFRSDSTFDIAARGENIGPIHGSGTWKLNGMQVVCSYQYDREGSIETTLPLDLVSQDAMAFGGVVYRRSAHSNATDQTDAK